MRIYILIATLGIASLQTACTSYRSNVEIGQLRKVGGLLPAISVVAPRTYDYFEYLLDGCNCFADVDSGYINNGWEVRVHRTSTPVGQVGTIALLMVSAASLFIIPTVARFEEVTRFDVRKDGKKFAEYEYTASKTRTTSLFGNPNAADDDSESRRIDSVQVQRFAADFSADLRSPGTGTN